MSDYLKTETPSKPIVDTPKVELVMSAPSPLGPAVLHLNKIYTKMTPFRRVTVEDQEPIEFTADQRSIGFDFIGTEVKIRIEDLDAFYNQMADNTYNFVVTEDITPGELCVSRA